MGDSVVRRAVSEAKEVSRLAVDAAKAEIVEQLTPAIKDLVERQLRRGAVQDDVDRLRRAADGYGETEFEEGKDEMKKDKKEESIANLFPTINEMGYGAEEQDEAALPEVAQEAADEEMDEAKQGEEDMDETIEISESELEAMYNEALQLEVDVKKGFSEMGKPAELDDTDPNAGLLDVKTGDKAWQDEEPPHKKDWTVKEIRQLVRRGMTENKKLAEENTKLIEMVRKMHGKLQEMNLLNSKILHVNQFLTRHRLNVEQKKAVIESIDKGGTVEEVKRIFSVLESSFKAAGAVTESRRPKADNQKRRTSGAADPQVLRESAGREPGDTGYDRWKQLAGLVNGK